MSNPRLSQFEEDDGNRSTDRRAFLQRATALVAGTAAVSLLKAQSQQPATTSASLCGGFKISKIQTKGATINVVSGGQGPPVLLLHGNPQTHVMWHKIAPRLAKEFTVVAADLRGYGDSSKPADGENHSNYSKRSMALDQMEVMSHFGFEKFAVVGHDRGGRVGHRLALDHPNRITKLVVLDIVPTYKLLHSVSNEVATAFYQWFFLVQPAPFPETLIANNAEFYHANCEDYRAAASIDMKHDEEDLNHKIACPVLALWGERGAVHRLFDVLSAWRERAANVSGKPLAGRHFLPEEIPDETLAELREFLNS